MKSISNVSTHVLVTIIQSQEKIKPVKWYFLNFNFNGQTFTERKNPDFYVKFQHMLYLRKVLLCADIDFDDIMHIDYLFYKYFIFSLSLFVGWLLFVALFLGCISTGRVGLCFLWFFVQELPKAKPAVVLVLKRLRRRGNGLKSHPTDWEKPGIEPATPGLQDKGLSPTPRRLHGWLQHLVLCTMLISGYPHISPIYIYQKSKFLKLI